MTFEGWRDAVLEAVRRSEAGDQDLLDSMARLLIEQDKAKNDLNRAGFGCIGMSWADVVKEIGER